MKLNSSYPTNDNYFTGLVILNNEIINILIIAWGK